MLALARRDVSGIQRSHRDADNNLVFVGQVLFVLAAHVKVCAGRPGLAQVELFFDAMPFVRVQLAGGEGLEGGAGRDGDVGDHEAGMVGWHVVVEGIRQDPVVSVEEEYEDSGEERYGAQLGERANL